MDVSFQCMTKFTTNKKNKQTKKNKTMTIRKKHGKDNSHISLNTIIAMDYACWLK